MLSTLAVAIGVPCENICFFDDSKADISAARDLVLKPC